MEGHEVKAALENRAEEVCEYLLPGGQVKNGQYKIGSLSGEKGNSLVIGLRGDKAGVWKDFASGEKGGNNLLDLWMKVRGLVFLDALNEAKKWLGVSDLPKVKPISRPKTRKETPPADPGKLFVPLVEGGSVHKWLTEDRKISVGALAAYGVGQSLDGALAAFPFRNTAGELVMVKFRSPDKKKMFVLPGGAPKCLFGIQAVGPEVSELFIVEGELDALSMFDLGHAAVSVPFGAKWENEYGTDPNTEWIDHDWEFLERFLGIWLALDADEPGRKATESIAPRLDRARCSLIDWTEGGVNDANEYVLQGGDALSFIEGPMGEAKDFKPQNLRNAAEYRQEVWDEFFNQDSSLLGDPPPWPMGEFRFRRGEVTVWTGYSKHGKTILLNYMLVHMASLGRKSCICSLEMKPRKILQNIIRQASAKMKPDDEPELDRALDWVGAHMWVYDRVGTADVADVLEAFKYAAKRYGVTHFVIDSLMRLNLDEGDDNTLKQVMNALCDFSLNYDVHVHLVAHSKKPDQKRPETKFWPNKHQVRGSVYVTNMAHNVVCVYRNKGKEEALQLNKLSAEDRAKMESTEDAMFIVQANRETGDEPLKRLWFDKNCWQYLEHQSQTPKYYIPFNNPNQSNQ